MKRQTVAITLFFITTANLDHFLATRPESDQTWIRNMALRQNRVSAVLVKFKVCCKQYWSVLAIVWIAIRIVIGPWVENSGLRI